MIKRDRKDEKNNVDNNETKGLFAKNTVVNNINVIKKYIFFLIILMCIRFEAG